MKIKMIKIALIFSTLYFVFAAPVAFAEEVPSASSGQAPPTTSPSQIVSSSGAPFNVGWNYFTVSAPECTVKNIFNELQAAGGGALLVSEIWKEENSQWKMFNVADLNSVKVTADNIFAFNSNQKFYLNIAADACKTKNTNRDLQIQQVRDASTKQNGDSFLEKLLSVPGDFWNGLFGKMEVNKQDNSLPSPKYSAETAVFTTLNVSGKTTVSDLGITGKITQGLLNINGLDNSQSNSATINTLSGDLYLQNNLLGGINILNGKVTIDTAGNLKTIGTLTTKKINIDMSDTNYKSAGSVTIKAGETEIEISTSALTPDSLIFATPNIPIAIGVDKKDATTILIVLKEASLQDIKVNWWIVN